MVLFSRDFKIEDGKAVIPLGITVQGDVLIIIYHARSTLGGRLQAKVRGGASGPGLTGELGPWRGESPSPVCVAEPVGSLNLPSMQP